MLIILIFILLYKFIFFTSEAVVRDVGVVSNDASRLNNTSLFSRSAFSHFSFINFNSAFKCNTLSYKTLFISFSFIFYELNFNQRPTNTQISFTYMEVFFIHNSSIRISCSIRISNTKSIFNIIIYTLITWCRFCLKYIKLKL